MTKEEQIIFLNSTVKVKLAPSGIHGIGVFAITDIPKGTKLNCFPDFYKSGLKWFDLSYGNLSKLFPEIRELVLERWPSIINGSHFLSPNEMVWLITFMNHADDPNYEVSTDTSLRDIKKGEEVTEDYRRMDNYEKIYPWLKALSVIPD